MCNKELFSTLSLITSGQLVADVVYILPSTTSRNLLFINYIYTYTSNFVCNFCKKIILWCPMYKNIRLILELISQVDQNFRDCRSFKN